MDVSTGGHSVPAPDAGPIRLQSRRDDGACRHTPLRRWQLSPLSGLLGIDEHRYSTGLGAFSMRPRSASRRYIWSSCCMRAAAEHHTFREATSRRSAVDRFEIHRSCRSLPNGCDRPAALTRPELTVAL